MSSSDAPLSSAPIPDDAEETIDWPLYLPLPYYYTFYDDAIIGNLDMFLHDTAVNYFSTRVRSTERHLLIPSLRLLDEWDTGDGSTYYLFHSTVYIYYDFEQFLEGFASFPNREHELGDSTSSSMSGYVRMKVTPHEIDCSATTNYWHYKAVEILESPPWGTDGDDIRMLAGTRPIAELLLEASNVPGGGILELDYIRDILPDEYAFDQHELLKVYMDYYFSDNRKS